ncbi:MAG: ABC transporter permease, partial [Ignavibacteriae bacterium]
MLIWGLQFLVKHTKIGNRERGTGNRERGTEIFLTWQLAHGTWHLAPCTMNKINVIIRHEYLTRVTSKWFVISTLLGPLGMALLIAIPVLAAALAGDGAEGKVAVVDRSGGIGAAVVASDTSRYVDAGRRTVDDLAADVRNEHLQAYVIVPENVLDAGELTMYSRGGTGFAFEASVERDFEPFVVKGRLLRAGTDTTVIDLVEKGISISALKITEEGVEQDASEASAAIGYGAGFVIYMLIFLYGTMVMRGVVEEKTNRIIEVIASSARPYEIMMGKVIGIGLVGLSQLVAWLVLGTAVIFALGAIFGGNVDSAQVTQSTQMMQQMQGANSPMMIGDV